MVLKIKDLIQRPQIVIGNQMNLGSKRLLKPKTWLFKEAILQAIRRRIVSGLQQKTSVRPNDLAAELVRAQMKRTKKSAPAKDKEKESIFRALTALMASKGVEVRREKLKQGHGWKVVSGACRHESQRLIFVDRRLSQDDQITFLISRISGLELEFDQEQLEELPEKIRERIVGIQVEETAA